MKKTKGDEEKHNNKHTLRSEAIEMWHELMVDEEQKASECDALRNRFAKLMANSILINRK